MTSTEGVSLNEGINSQMAAMILPADATDASVTWSVTNGTGEGSITSEGMFTAVSEGTVMILAVANDDSGVSGQLEVEIESKETILRVDGDDIFELYPNPVLSSLTIELGSNIIEEFMIIGINGKVVIQSKFFENTIDVSHLSEGFYAIRLTTSEGKVLTSSFIKK